MQRERIQPTGEWVEWSRVGVGAIRMTFKLCGLPFR